MEKVLALGKGSEGKAPPRGRARPRPLPTTLKRYTFDFKVRTVKLYLEEGFGYEEVCAEAGIASDTLRRWVKAYRERGEAALQPSAAFIHPKRLDSPVQAQIVALKQENPTFGVKRISQFMRRMLHLPGSAETVRRTLHQEGLIEPVPRKPKRNPAKPRFFERATPNQMWQSDIFIFRLGGANAYLIGFLDDYSRFITGLELFRSQTAENLLEVYRRAVAEYGVPREMLTDNGRQYTNWRGRTLFEREMEKEKVHHLRSQPHHPMTLGKIERFWKSLYEEFLVRAQFDGFESARERIRYWVQYYNYRRPHQGIGGLCPADRFFEVRHELRKVIDQGIAENIRELALRGMPQRPFYMVGRLDNQSVVMQAVKGKLVMTVNDEVNKEARELVYDIEKGKVHDGDAQEDAQAGASEVCRAGEVRGGAGPVDGAADQYGVVPADGTVVDAAEQLGEVGSGGDVDGAGTEATAAPGHYRGPEQTAGETAREEGTEEHNRIAPESQPGGQTGGGPSGESAAGSGHLTAATDGRSLAPRSAADSATAPGVSVAPGVALDGPADPGANGLLSTVAERACPSPPDSESVLVPGMSREALTQLLRLVAAETLDRYLAQVPGPRRDLPAAPPHAGFAEPATRLSGSTGGDLSRHVAIERDASTRNKPGDETSERKSASGTECRCPPPRGADSQSAFRDHVRHSGGSGTGCLTQNVLRMGEPGSGRHDAGAAGPGTGPSAQAGRPGERADAGPTGGEGEGSRAFGAAYGAAGPGGRDPGVTRGADAGSGGGK